MNQIENFIRIFQTIRRGSIDNKLVVAEGKKWSWFKFKPNGFAHSNTSKSSFHALRGNRRKKLVHMATK